MTAIEVVLAAKQRCRLIQQCVRNIGQVLRQTVDFLIKVRLHQVKDATGCELVRLIMQSSSGRRSAACLAQWKIVPKRAVDFAFDLQDAPASSRSSVNNCTGGLRSEDSNPTESFSKIDPDGMSRKERRRLLAQIRAQQPQKLHKKLRRSDKIEAACDDLISQVRDLSGETISRGLAVRLIGGTQTEIAGRMFRSSAYGDLLRPHRIYDSTAILMRIERLARQSSTGRTGE